MKYCKQTQYETAAFFRKEIVELEDNFTIWRGQIHRSNIACPASQYPICVHWEDFQGSGLPLWASLRSAVVHVSGWQFSLGRIGGALLFVGSNFGGFNEPANFALFTSSKY